jgi:parallel beta-helix repeat protein
MVLVGSYLIRERKEGLFSVRKTLAGIILALLLSGLFLSMFDPKPVRASETIVVPEDYSTIQGAIDASNPGDTIIVSEGTYAEGMIVVSKSLTIRANGSVTVDGLNENNVFFIHASGVSVQGFTIVNSSSLSPCAGIWSLRNGALTISGNTITNCSNGIWMENPLKGNVISNNMITGNSHYGVVLLEYPDHCIVVNNTITNNGAGFYIVASDGNTISDNTIINNWIGIILFSSNNNTIIRNTITRNNGGIWGLSNSMENTIVGNTIEMNYYGVYVENSDDNVIHHNNFVNNTQQVLTPASNNTWDNSYPSGGNHWSDYTGTDMYSGPEQNQPGSDGIGDTPYIIDAANQDHYPLMVTWEALQGDLNWDGSVNIFDLVVAAAAYSSKQGDPNWNALADVAEQWGIIDIFDIVVLATNYGKSLERH